MPRQVTIIGLGGLGCPVSLALAQHGVQRLTLIDDDVVEPSNLHRQPWHGTDDVGVPKVESAATKLGAAFPSLQLTTLRTRVTAANVLGLFEASELVIDATDGVGTKFLLSDASVLSQRPLIYGGVVRFEGLAMRIAPGGPCLRCVFERPPDDAPTCAQAGVMGSMAGLVGGLQAKLACELSEPGLSTMWAVDGKALSLRRVKVRRRDACLACGEGRTPSLSDLESATCDVESTSPVRSAP